jgi:hypothetical protein
MSLCSFDKNRLNLFVIFYIAVIFILLYTTPFTLPEANILYSNKSSLTNYLATFFDNLNHNYIYIRASFFIISLINIYLFYKVSNLYIKDDKFSSLATFIYLITPGVFVSNILVNYATIPIFLALSFIYSYTLNQRVIPILVLVLLLFTNIASFVFYLAIVLYSYRKKDWILFIVAISLLILSSAIETYPIDGIPKGHLLQVLGVYGATLSPFYFLAILYAVYRVAINKQKSLLWYIVSSFIIVSLILSIRQKIKVTDFTPFVVIGSILVILVYKDVISIRLKIFQKRYKIVCMTVVSVLLLETSLVVLNYPLYKLFGSRYHIIDTSMYKIAEDARKKCTKNRHKRYKNLYKYYSLEVCN